MLEHINEDIITKILQNWITVNDLCKYDTAICNNKYLNDIYSKTYFMVNTKNINKEYTFKWLINKQIKFNMYVDVYKFDELFRYTYLNLENIKLRNENLTDEIIILIANNCCLVTHFDICCDLHNTNETNPQITDNGVKEISKLEKLKQVKICCHSNTNITDESIIKISKNCKLLESFVICIDNNKNITNDGIIEIAKNCDKLKSLVIYCRMTTNLTKSAKIIYEEYESIELTISLSAWDFYENAWDFYENA